MAWLYNCRTFDPSRAINLKRAQLETAKEILAEVFHVRPSVVEDMIQIRLEERCLAIEQKSLSDEGLWPAKFCLGE